MIYIYILLTFCLSIILLIISIFRSVVSVFEPSIDLGQGPVTGKELLLYFDPPECIERAKFLTQELFEPPSSPEMLEKIRHEFKNLRCVSSYV